MRAILVGADFEENLGLGFIAACLEKAGHRTSILPFNVARDTEPLVRRIVSEAPEMVGLSIQFQHRAHEFLGLSRALRRAGYRGHVTSGAQFPTLAFREVLEGDFGVDSVVLHDGEETVVDLARAIESGAALHDVAGLALRGHDGLAFRTGERRMPDELDEIPFPVRYRAHNKHMNVPFVPLVGGRGCWSKCSYCSIVAFYRDGREHGGGRLFRLRSPENVAEEMALLWHRAKQPCIFCFHDDNFTLPSPAQTLARVQAIRDALDDYGVGTIGIVGKARPDTITPELARGLAELGVIRLYVGVENASQAGGDHLRRGTQQNHVREALKSCREAGIFNCYNLLVFEPKTTIADARENAEFIRDHADHPVNFCRAEPYHGTPLHLEIAREQDLGGSYLGWNYRIEDDPSELLFRVCSAAFRERNFGPRGVANRYMGLGYAGNVLRRFFPGTKAERLRERSRLLTRAISLDTYEHFSRAIELVEEVGMREPSKLEALTARLALDVSAADRKWHAALDDLYGEMTTHTEEPREKERFAPTAKLLKAARSMTLSASVAAAASATSGCYLVHERGVDGDQQPDSGFVVDPAPIDAGRDAGRDAGQPDSGFVVDPAPIDAARVDAGDDSGFVVDPPPPDANVDMGVDMGFFEVAPVPTSHDEARERVREAGEDRARMPGEPRGPRLAEAEDDDAYLPSGALKRRLRLVDQWRDSAPRDAIRTRDLPLAAPPAPELRAVRDGDIVRVAVLGVADAFSTRWEAEGAIEGDGPAVAWRPASAEDQIAVAVRTRGGVAVVTVRASAI
jgi:radical SAM superfamily enzyme YgiQ (UPF0313 family)